MIDEYSCSNGKENVSEDIEQPPPSIANKKVSRNSSADVIDLPKAVSSGLETNESSAYTMMEA